MAMLYNNHLLLLLEADVLFKFSPLGVLNARNNMLYPNLF